MKDLLNRLYATFSKILNLRMLDVNANHPDIYPVVGFLLDEKVLELEKILKVKINNPSIFEQALTHRSYLTVVGTYGGYRSNERLEFLGDSLLNLIVSDFLFKSNSDFSEGDLTKLRSRIVNSQSLSHCGHSLGIEKFIMLSFSAEKALKEGSDSIVADTIEALIAAIYIDSGFNSARYFVVEVLLPIILKSNLIYDSNYKSLLLEKVQSLGLPSPVYKVLSESGPDHCKHFQVGVYVENILLGTGEGRNKKAAEQDAAHNAIELNLFTNIKEKCDGNVDN
jgi:ribonuclease-3